MADSEYTPEQSRIVNEILNSRSYYKILGVNKDATVEQIKSAYKKLAIQVHPDKNRSPGAEEAFKAVGRAFSVLSDPEKRLIYNLQSTIFSFTTDEDLNSFNEFLKRRNAEPQSQASNENNQTDQKETPKPKPKTKQKKPANPIFTKKSNNPKKTFDGLRSQDIKLILGFSSLLLVLPIIIGLIPESTYSLQRTQFNSVSMKTLNRGIPYFVEINFEFKVSRRIFEKSVEEEYISNLKSSCYKDMNYRDSLMWKARNFGSRQLFKEAHYFDLSACDKLQTFNVIF